LGNFFGHVFLPAAWAQLFAFGFLPLKINLKKKQKQCAACGLLQKA